MEHPNGNRRYIILSTDGYPWDGSHSVTERDQFLFSFNEIKCETGAARASLLDEPREREVVI